MIDCNTHEELLIFLDDHISKLVKLKAASRAKYKEYDQLYMDYLTAESCHDDIRVKLYGDMVENCHDAMRTKLKKALAEHPELLADDVVAEYQELME